MQTSRQGGSASVTGYWHYDYQRAREKREPQLPVAWRSRLRQQLPLKRMQPGQQGRNRVFNQQGKQQDLGLFRAILRELQGRRQRRGSTETVPENNNRLHDIALSLRSGRPGYNHCQRVWKSPRKKRSVRSWFDHLDRRNCVVRELVAHGRIGRLSDTSYFDHFAVDVNASISGHL